MKKFEHNDAIVANTTTQSQKGSNTNWANLLPSLMKLLPNINLNNLFSTQKTENHQRTSDFSNNVIQNNVQYPQAPSVESYRQNQIKNTLCTINAHNYLVKSIREGNATASHSHQYQPVDTSPNNPLHQYHQVLEVTTDSIPPNYLEEQ